ncbi:general transcription factor 3C polypeptide 6-like [Lolium rigidum]|uniref:general transcription factor 3C polypeptide 6-like n=1 Tax=Lolium rigidum TaxID=89674 RepID=UPI001F5DC6B4|nr:general transcription factor 3C polypeptide 6-like [Lolium rigidum]
MEAWNRRAKRRRKGGDDDNEEEEYVLLELDDCFYYNVQPNSPYILSGLDTLTPTLIVGDGLKMIGEYKETVGTCYAFSESDAPPKSIHDGMAPPKENKGKQASNSKEAPARSKAVKHLSSVQKILKFRSIGEDHQDYRAYLDKDK